MKVLSLSIEERLTKAGKPYKALIMQTDDKDHPEKFLGIVQKGSIKFMPIEKSKNNE